MTTYAKPAVGSAWAETAANPADIITMSDADVKTGWPLSGTPPSRQRFNYLLNWCTNAIRYFMQRGLVDYDAAETYQLNAVVTGDDGATYKSIQNANSGHAPSTNPAWWTPWGLTLAQINASQLTQADIGTGDHTTKVANTNFVTAACAALATVVAANLASAVSTLTAAIAAVTAFVTGGFTISLTTNGYVKFPTWASGLIIQWCDGAYLATEASHVITFPITFPTACLKAVVGTELDVASGGMDIMFQLVGAPTQTGCTVQAQDMNGTVDHSRTITANVIAVGY